MLKRTIYLVAIVCLLMSGMTMASVFYGYTPLADNLWSNSANWAGDTLVAPHNPPAAGDTALIWDGKSVTVNYAAPEFLVFRGRAGSTVNIEAGGSLAFYAGWTGDNAGSGAAGQIIINGGSLTATRTDDGSPGIRIAEGAGSSGIITLNSGSVTTRGLQVGSEVSGNCTGKFNLFGGVVNLLMNSNASLYLYSYGKMEMRDSGTLIMAGDRRNLLNGWEERGVHHSGYIENGLLYTEQAGKSLNVNYDGIDTIVTVIPEPITIALLVVGGLLMSRKK